MSRDARIPFNVEMEFIVNVDAVTCNLAEVCQALYKLAQRHIPSNAFADTNELLHITKILKAAGVKLRVAANMRAQVKDHIPEVARQSADYRLLKAQFRAALSTIADLGCKKSKTHKSDYHAGVHVGLRHAAKIAIMFLADFDDDETPIAEKVIDGSPPAKSRSPFVR